MNRILHEILILIENISTNICDFQILTNPKKRLLSFSITFLSFSITIVF